MPLPAAGSNQTSQFCWHACGPRRLPGKKTVMEKCDDKVSGGKRPDSVSLTSPVLKKKEATEAERLKKMTFDTKIPLHWFGEKMKSRESIELRSPSAPF